MPTVPANNLFTMGILHCFLGCKEPLYHENLKLGQSNKRGKHESGNKKYAKNDYLTSPVESIGFKILQRHSLKHSDMFCIPILLIKFTGALRFSGEK